MCSAAPGRLPKINPMTFRLSSLNMSSPPTRMDDRMSELIAVDMHNNWVLLPLTFILFALALSVICSRYSWQAAELTTLVSFLVVQCRLPDVVSSLLQAVKSSTKRTRLRGRSIHLGGRSCRLASWKTSYSSSSVESLMQHLRLLRISFAYPPSGDDLP